MIAWGLGGAGAAALAYVGIRAAAGTVSTLTNGQSYRLSVRSVDAQHSTTQVTFITGATVDLAPGALFRARVTLSAAQNLIPTSLIRSKLEAMGFTFVTIYSNASQLPQDWPATETADQSGAFGATIWLEGLYGGAAQTIARPPVTADIWASGLVAANAQTVVDELALLSWEATSVLPNQNDPFVWTAVAKWHGLTGAAPADGTHVFIIHVANE